MNEIPTRISCRACSGKGKLSTGQICKFGGQEHMQLVTCQACEGRGTQIEWLDVGQLALLLNAIAAEEKVQ